MTIADEACSDVISRLERLPLMSFHIKLRFVIGVATFFDLFDAIMIAFVIPALITPWSLTPWQIGALISSAYAGQFIGALFFGWLAGKIGRRRTILATTVFFGLGSLLVAGAWNFQSMLVLRALQGVGLGGEVPVASAYLSEWIAAPRRGRYVAFFEMAAPLGILVAGLAGAWIVPLYGWRWMFVIGAIPALFVFPLRRRLPESPRYLLRTNRVDEAERIVADLERDAKGTQSPPSSLAEAPGFVAAQPSIARRAWSVALLWFACYFINYGLTAWLPSIYRSVFHLDVSLSLRLGLATSAAGVVGAVLCGLLIDRIGRRNWFALAFLGAAAPLIALALIRGGDALTVAALCSISYVFVSGCSAALYLYTPEIFPTSSRAFGTGVGSACARVASALAPLLVGMILAQSGPDVVFLMFGTVAVAGAILSLPLEETAGRRLESIVSETGGSLG
jgi:putative MFS transporter